ncbi:MAG: hypothetical protein LBH95_10200 [Oscillospiraceae bacterium]|jgi:hypothetical protein|nr:hypothetical protein [Oscillospiraceae bacterium]
MVFWNKRKKNPSQDIIRQIAGQRLKYVTERDPATSVESVVGRRGSVSITAAGKLKVVCGMEVFSAGADNVRAAMLMSLEGAVLSGYDETAGRERTIVVYFQYYRKV